MSLDDQVNRLPTELLNQVFDYLTSGQCSTASTVCTRWAAILRDQRYFGRRHFFLQPEHLLEENVDVLKRLQAVEIYFLNFTSPDHMRKLREYLSHKELLANLKQLDLTCLSHVCDDIFGTDQEISLPELQVLSISIVGWVYEPFTMKWRIVAPNLKVVYVNKESTRPLLVKYSEQIEKLGIVLTRGMLQAIDNLHFVNLRCVDLTVVDTEESVRNIWNESFSEAHRSMFGRLKRLDIRDWNGLLNSGEYSLIFKEAKDLEALHIYGGNLDRNDLIQLNQLKKLKQLTMMITVNDQDEEPEIGLSLPNLVFLITFASALVPLENVPSLTSLVIANHDKLKQRGFGFHHTDLKEYFRPFGHQLEKLRLYQVYLNDNCIEQLCTLTNLVSLKMNSTEATTSGINKLMSWLPKVRLARFEDCSFADQMLTCEYGNFCFCYICEGEREECDASSDPDESSELEQRANFYGNLTEQYKDCLVVAASGQVTKRNVSIFCSHHVDLNYNFDML